MPGGGIWLTQNKRRPGAYINFRSVPRAVGTLGTRGVVALAMPMSWGPEGALITLHGDDLTNGKSIPIVGCDAFDAAASLPYRVACAGAYTALLYRTDRGGTKASVIIAGTYTPATEDDPEVDTRITAVAKYNGVRGNKLVVEIAEKEGTSNYNVNVLFGEIKKETFLVASLEELKAIESQYIEITVGADAVAVPETAGSPLEGGTDGEVSTDTYSEFLSLLEHKNFQAVAIRDTTSSVVSALETKIRSWRENIGKKVQAVVYNSPDADYEGIISVDQGFKTDDDVVDTDLFPLWVASKTAGAAINESLTCSVVENAKEIINPVDEADFEDELSKGRFMLSYREDGAVIVEKDINTLQTFTSDKNYEFSKNRVIRCLDEIGNTTKLVFTRNYSGKENNDDTGRDNYKGELISMLDQLQGVGAITNFAGAGDITVIQGDEVDNVYVEYEIQPVDAMEKLYTVVNVKVPTKTNP